MKTFHIKISNPKLSHKGKVFLIKHLFISNKKHKVAIENNVLNVTPDFKDECYFNNVVKAISNILENNCENMDDKGDDCSCLYDCCCCGYNDDDDNDGCGCCGCFSCNACDACKE